MVFGVDPGAILTSPTINTGLLIVLAIVQHLTRKRASRERASLAQQIDHVAECVADTRRVAKESHNDLVEVARENTERVMEKRYDDSPDSEHHFERKR